MQLTPRSVAGDLIAHAQHVIAEKGLRPALHFEMEGTITPAHPHPFPHLKAVNALLKQRGILGELQEEFWPGQWEYVSSFAGQTPLEEASYLQRAIDELPHLFAQFGAQSTSFCPVTWNATTGRMLSDSRQIFSTSSAPVHIPNAIQINVSVMNKHNENLFATGLLAELYQQRLLETSYGCCLLFLPEEDAYRRLALRRSYGLDQELSSPFDISGGHQGSIALYRDKGKHNQRLGINPLLLATNGDILIEDCNWQIQSRVEHRLGATSLKYCPWINVLYMLLNLLEAIEQWQTLPEEQQKQQLVTIDEQAQHLPDYLGTYFPEKIQEQTTLTPDNAINRFVEQTWFANAIQALANTLPDNHSLRALPNIGRWMQQQILSQYQIQSVITDLS